MKLALTSLVVAGSLAVVAAPAQADEVSAATPSAEQQCRTERAQMGTQAFKLTYGTNANRSNAFGKCVSKRDAATAKAEKAAKSNAAKECKAERAADSAAFAKKYGTNKNGSNAYGKCVSSKAKAQAVATVEEQVDADVAAAKSCKAERAAGRAAFEAKYGTNRNKRNAFGKCVSAKAKAAAQQS